jgi:hypothetical protein
MNESYVPDDLFERVCDALEPYLLGGEEENITIESNPPDLSVSFHSSSPIFNGFDLRRLTTTFNEKVINRTWYGRMTSEFDGYERDPVNDEIITSIITHVHLYIVHGLQDSELNGDW